jgi:hypothetical protein
MNLEVHSINGIKIAEVLSDQVIINTIDDGVALFGNIYYQGFDNLVLHKKILHLNFSSLAVV